MLPPLSKYARLVGVTRVQGHEMPTVDKRAAHPHYWKCAGHWFVVLRTRGPARLHIGPVGMGETVQDASMNIRRRVSEAIMRGMQP